MVVAMVIAVVIVVMVAELALVGVLCMCSGPGGYFDALFPVLGLFILFL
jgi:hypothetical protein